MYLDSEVGKLSGDLNSDTWKIDLKAKFKSKLKRFFAYY